MKEQPIKIADRKDRKYTLSPLGYEACRWIEQQEKAAKPLPMDTLPHREIKKVQS